jgi:UDP-GlcNAc:undecaprenyl-phosphate/decaprenyl-phosphate GlcNAc-1-phosphate transferase
MSIEAILKYPVVVLAGLLAALLLTPLWRRVAPRWGFMDRPGMRKIHQNPVPRGGGLAVFIGFQVACAVVFLVPWKPFAGQLSIEWWFRFLPLSAGVVTLGLLDDRWDLKPLVKLAGQIALAVAAYALDIRLQNILGVALPGWVDAVATVLWFVALMNAFNLIDGVDGLATGIALIAAMGIGLSLVFRGEPGDVLLFMGFAGACLGFLRYNYYPASVFLGDTGSMFLGFTLAALSISTHSKASFMAGIGVPLLAVGVPLFDTLLAIWRRSMRHVLNRSADAGTVLGLDRADVDHLHHRLLRKFHGQGQVAWLLYAATALLVAVGILASVFHDRALGILVLAFLLAAYTVVRHLAGIELLESGKVVLQGISRPVRRNRTLLVYIAGDLLILNLALLVGHALLDLQDGMVDVPMKAAWLRAVPVDVVIPFVSLLLFRSYSRVWYLARVSEYAATGLAVMIGYAVACGVHLLGAENRAAAAALLLYYLLLAGIAAPAVVFTRAAVRVVQDLMQWRSRGVGPEGVAPVRALICGAGYRTTLFLRQLAFRTHDRVPVDIVGLVSDDSAIAGHDVHGIRVIGLRRDLPALVARHRVDILYLIEAVSDADIEELRQTLGGSGVRLIRWDIVETEIPPASHA